jgi:hypothetical protein
MASTSPTEARVVELCTPTASPVPSSVLPGLRFDVSAFDNTWDNVPKPHTSSLAGLVRALTTFPVSRTSNKLALPAWSPAKFVDGSVRCAAAVETVCCLVLDFDAGDPDVALAAWAGTMAVLHSTWSHTPECPRFRLVVPLARPVPVDRWAAAWRWAAARSPGADPACKDPSRLYFRPALRSADAAHLSTVQQGELLDVLALMDHTPPPVAPFRRYARPEIHVPARLRDHAVRARLRSDPVSRERAAAELGAVVSGTGSQQRATGVACPACRRPSVWFYVAPARLRGARCNHRNSCGWTGGLDELLGGRGV